MCLTRALARNRQNIPFNVVCLITQVTFPSRFYEFKREKMKSLIALASAGDELALIYVVEECLSLSFPHCAYPKEHEVAARERLIELYLQKTLLAMRIHFGITLGYMHKFSLNVLLRM